MPKREMRLVPTQPLGRRHHGHAPLTAGTPGEARGIDPPPARPPGALWRLPGAAQPLAWERPPHATPARAGRGDGHRVAVLELGAAAASGLCAGHGTLPVLSARDTAAHRRHHAGRSDPQDPPPSETLCRPSPHRACPCAPRPRGLGRRRPRRQAWARQPRARRGGGCTPLRVYTLGLRHSA